MKRWDTHMLRQDHALGLGIGIGHPEDLDSPLVMLISGDQLKNLMTSLASAHNADFQGCNLMNMPIDSHGNEVPKVIQGKEWSLHPEDR